METSISYKTKIKIGLIEIEVEGDKDHVSNEPMRLINELQKQNVFLSEATLTSSQNVVIPGLKSQIEPLISTNEIPHLKEFVAQKSPKGAQEVALLIAYYLFKFENKESFDEDALKKCWIICGAKPVKNIWQIILNSKLRKGWYEEVSKANYKIGIHGIYHVEKELPAKK